LHPLKNQLKTMKLSFYLLSNLPENVSAIVTLKHLKKVCKNLLTDFFGTMIVMRSYRISELFFTKLVTVNL